ncbi:hydroxyacyl-CoA dehydrogenase trifunctional multienzyme complex subunit alpha a [Siniperca chuatsi]|uniref:hydroxyacyl-CoA dehydrogenase trifunctional multienzyme complex subunit alpha a n=1 Tax=Siniperca chuatsi TaxID=119488 RepID=UPI001CE04F7F|nr:hydroxyacyl-CoA dehydrogenase trifunctional multienzyme complex subunit alpha a [Siniperca chuatsi]
MKLEARCKLVKLEYVLCARCVEQNTFLIVSGEDGSCSCSRLFCFVLFFFKFATSKYTLLSGQASRSLSLSSSLAARTHVSYELKDDVAVIRLSDPTAKVNTLLAHMESELTEVMGMIWSNGAVKSAVFISSKPFLWVIVVRTIKLR